MMRAMIIQPMNGKPDQEIREERERQTDRRKALPDVPEKHPKRSD